MAIEKPRERWLKSLSSLELHSICFASLIYLSENWGEIEVQEEGGTFADKCSENVQDRGGDDNEDSYAFVPRSLSKPQILRSF